MSQALSIDGKKATKSKYVLVIPVERNSSFWLLNNYVFVLLCQILSFSTFALEMPKQAGDILGITLALYFLLVAYKFALMNGLPRLSYFTHFDSYLWLVFALLFVQYVLQTLLLWVKDPGDNFADRLSKTSRLHNFVYRVRGVAKKFSICLQQNNAQRRDEYP